LTKHALPDPGAIVFVITADQKDSRGAPDHVPAMLEILNGHRVVRAFERTAGDEVQGLLDDAGAVVGVLVALVRAGWWVGIGVGDVDRPLPRSARAGRGDAYVAARRAVEAAKSAPGGVAVASGDGAAGVERAERAEAAAWLLAALLSRRTREGWEVIDLVAAGANGVEAAAKLGISPQAVSSRLRVAGWAEEQRGRALLQWLIARVGSEPEAAKPEEV
jgi:hypothetical protein